MGAGHSGKFVRRRWCGSCTRYHGSIDGLDRADRGSDFALGPRHSRVLEFGKVVSCPDRRSMTV